MRLNNFFLAVTVLGSALQVAAQELPPPPGLPSTPQAISWIDGDAMVMQARRELEAAQHGRQALIASPYEWSARVAAQRRNYRGTNTNSNEWSAQLERPVRINGKAGLDRSLGELDVEVARARLAQARHEAARALVDLWVDVLAADGQQTLVQEQLSFAQRSLDAVERRRRAGDAAVLDSNVARTDLAEVERQASMVATQVAKARARLRVRFPGEPPAAGSVPDPVAPEWPEPQWQARIVAAADSVRAAEAQLRRARVAADRARADRVPDPTIGVFTASEAQRNERLVGISVSVPLSGEYRSQRMRQALSEAEAAEAAVERERRDAASGVAETYTEALGAVRRWQIAEQGAATARSTAQLTQRAFSLGEAQVQGLLLARRQALEATRAAFEARTDALRWRARLLVDAHLIWNLAED